MASRLANTMSNSLKGRPVQGGLSSSYKKNVAEKGLTDETYTADSITLIRISGTSIHNNKVVQVDAVCFLSSRSFMVLPIPVII
ncbi:hypothetical protein CsatB_017847 [Cannabis sativa]